MQITVLHHLAACSEVPTASQPETCCTKCSHASLPCTSNCLWRFLEDNRKIRSMHNAQVRLLYMRALAWALLCVTLPWGPGAEGARRLRRKRAVVWEPWARMHYYVTLWHWNGESSKNTFAVAYKCSIVFIALCIMQRDIFKGEFLDSGLLLSVDCSIFKNVFV